MKIVVDYDLCESNAVCMSIAPDLFEVRDDNFLYVLDEHPASERFADVQSAVASCPTGAISFVEDE